MICNPGLASRKARGRNTFRMWCHVCQRSSLILLRWSRAWRTEWRPFFSIMRMRELRNQSFYFSENDSFQRLGVEKARKIWDSLLCLSFIETCEGLDDTCTWMVSVLCSISFSALGRGVLHIPNDSIWRDGVQEDRWSEDRNLRCRELQDAATWAGFIRSVLGMPRHAVPKKTTHIPPQWWKQELHI